MKVKWQGFAGENHSWSVCAQSISRAFIKSGHIVDIFSTNGIGFFPEDLKNNLIGYFDTTTKKIHGQEPSGIYDVQLTYTAIKNAPLYLNHGSKNRFLIWTYEFIGKNALPDGFAKHYKSCDLILPPSNFAKQVFIESGIPESHMRVIPHGVDFNQIEMAEVYKLRTKKSTVIGMVIGQVHRRKNLPDMLEMYGKAFSKKDDVCLVIKVQDRKPTQPFELSFSEILYKFKDKFKNHAEVEIVREFIPNIFSFYKACDIVFYATNCEGFGMISLEAQAAGKINIASRYGGVLDFCDDENSLLVNGEEFTVPSNYLYWSNKRHTRAFLPNIDDGVDKLRFAYNNKTKLLQQANLNINNVKNKYTWDNVASQITELVSNG